MLHEAPSIFTDRSMAWEHWEKGAVDRRYPTRPGMFVNARSFAGQPCPYCAKTMLTHDSDGEPLDAHRNERFPTRDHITPRVRGGQDVRDNIAVVCRACNTLKEDLTPLEWLDLLRADRDPQADILAALIRTDPKKFGRHAADAVLEARP